MCYVSIFEKKMKENLKLKGRGDEKESIINNKEKIKINFICNINENK